MRGLGAEGLDDYEPPSVQIAEDLKAAGKQPESSRRMEVLRFVAEAGGE